MTAVHSRQPLGTGRAIHAVAVSGASPSAVLSFKVRFAAGFGNYPEAFNPGQQDLGLDAYGDACELDLDQDGALTADNICPNIVNPGLENNDHVGIGDACCCVGASGNVNKWVNETPGLLDLSLLIAYLTQIPRPMPPSYP